MPRLRDEEDGFDIPLTPLIDVVFLLLIFFLVATNFTRKEIDHQINLPQAEGGDEEATPPQVLVINVREDGTIVISGRIVEQTDLPAVVKEWREKNPHQKAMIRADEAVPYRVPRQVMGICRSAGVAVVDLPVAEPGSTGG